MDNGQPEMTSTRTRSIWSIPWPRIGSKTSTPSSPPPPPAPKWSFGVINPKTTTEVPGTILLLHRQTEPSTAPSPTSELEPPPPPTRPPPKTTPDGTIILSPQPSHSPNDPLNWPRWRRDAALLSLGLYCSVGGGMPPLLAAGFTDISTSYSVPLHRVALTTGLLMLGLGIGAVLAGPTAILYGKRPVYLGSVIAFLAATVWCALSPDFASLLVARVVQGLAISPVEALPSATIAEMFFLHERSFRIGVYTLMLLGGKNLVPLVSAAVIERWGWRWVFWIVVMVGGFCGVMLFLFMHETFWDRREVRDGRDGGRVGNEGTEKPGTVENENENESQPGSSTLTLMAPEPTTNASSDTEKASPPLDYTSHRLASPSHWHHVAVRPLLLFLYPSILYSAFLYACSLGWLIVISESVAVIYRSRGSYHLSALSTGLVYISPFVGGVLGSAFGGRISDLVVRVMARQNRGVYEPEFRLVMVVPVAVCTVGGLIGFGWSAGVGDVWIVPTVWFGVVSFGCALGSTTAITFCVDSYKQFAGEALVTLNFSKNVLHGMVFSLFVTGWVESDGPRKVYLWIGIIQMVVLLFTVPMYLFGKRARHWTAGDNFWVSRSVIFREG
ncbi:major facilitator superfamily domain-containing protein [Cercophora newfieldiana]|uniref:Major facilitator superfamily domain-containing protein n=1 Tax=Cercophora newfieldiana TaxID=92897 RepID=A0AA39YHG1_9PEZI|nr:major facilitator superfamily domain-containing protein [Cercophora newfieldiana]